MNLTHTCQQPMTICGGANEEQASSSALLAVLGSRKASTNATTSRMFLIVRRLGVLGRETTIA